MAGARICRRAAADGEGWELNEGVELSRLALFQTVR
jgi:hypothetical protein